MHRPIVIIIAALGLTLTLTGCGNDETPADPPASPASPTAPTTPEGPPPVTFSPTPDPIDHGWEGTYEIDFDTGKMTAAGFNDLVDADSPHWADNPLSTVSVLLRLDRAEGTLDTDETTENGDAVVVVTLSDLADDSVTAMRYRIVLTLGDDDRYRFSSGAVSWLCHEGRGPADFDTERCL